MTIVTGKIMTIKKTHYEVGSRDNEYAGLTNSAISKRPRTLYYLRGPGSPGPHGILMSPELYFDTFEEAERAIPMLDLENSNNPPAAVLELNEKQAKFLLENCNTNIHFMLNALQSSQMAGMGADGVALKRETLEKLIEIGEQFKEIRTMLVKQGVTDE